MSLRRGAARRVLMAAAISALGTVAVASPAAMAAQKPGAWGNQAGIQHLHFETAPITIKPGQNTVEFPAVADSEKPSVDGYIIKMKPDLVYLNGKVPPVDVIHLHHGVWLKMAFDSPASPLGGLEPVFFGGEEKTVFRIPRGYGYQYKASDKWIIDQMIHNNTPNKTLVRLVWDLDFIPASTPLAKTVKKVVPLWMDVRRGSGYPVFDTIRGTGGPDGKYTFPDERTPSPYGPGQPRNEYTMPFDATIVAAVGHLHPGGLYDDVDVIRPGATLPAQKACRRVATRATGGPTVRRCVRAAAGAVPNSARIFRSTAKYYDPAGPVSWDVSLTASRPDWRVKLNKGDTVRINSTYENRISSWYENMGIVLLYAAVDDTTGLDPFQQPIDWRGVLTHGHLAENNNHGGKRTGLADPRTVASGPQANTVDIKGYQFIPGDLGTLSAGGKVPTVPVGQSLNFVNQDDPAFEWHSITTCAAPCNRSTGISYPLANGQNGIQFDSGQLGYGPAGLAPATNSLTYRTPDDLPAGTYTYFCRVHNFMRGSFRVIQPG